MHACVCVCVCGLTHWQVGFSCTRIKLFIQHGIMLLPLMYGDYIPQHVWLIGKIPPKNCNIKFGMCSGNSPLEVIALDCMFTTTNRLPACPQRLSEQQGPDLSALQQCGKLSWQYYKIEHITPLYCCVFLSYNSGHLFKCHYSHVCSLLLVVHWRKGLDEEAHIQYSLSSWPAIKEDQHTPAPVVMTPLVLLCT